MLFPLAEVVKLVDTHVSGTCEETRGGSSPLLGTTKKYFQFQSYLKKIVRHRYFPFFLIHCGNPKLDS